MNENRFRKKNIVGSKFHVLLAKQWGNSKNNSKVITIHQMMSFIIFKICTKHTREIFWWFFKVFQWIKLCRITIKTLFKHFILTYKMLWQILNAFRFLIIDVFFFFDFNTQLKNENPQKSVITFFLARKILENTLQ